MSHLRTAFHAAACACLCLVARAQAASLPDLPPPAPPALRDRVHALWARSPDVQAAEAERRAAAARVRAADQPVYNPTLSLEGENADVDRRTASASLALDIGGKRRARVEESHAALMASEAAYALRRRDIAVQWLKAWASVGLLHRQDMLGRERVAAMQRFDDLAERRLRVGDLSAPERDLAALALAEARIAQASLEGQQAAAMATLAALGDGMETGLPALPEGLPPPPDGIVPREAEQRPELAQAYAEQRRRDAAVDVARRARVPDPVVSLTGGRVRSGTRSDPVIGLSVAIALPVRNSGRAEIAAAQAEADAALAQRQAVGWQTASALRQAADTYRTLRQTADTLRRLRAEPTGPRTLLLERLWQAGELDTSDYLVQLNQHLDTALATLALETQTWQAWFDYLVATGRLGDWIDGPAQDANP